MTLLDAAASPPECLPPERLRLGHLTLRIWQRPITFESSLPPNEPMKPEHEIFGREQAKKAMRSTASNGKKV